MSETEAPSEGIPAESDLSCSFKRSVQAADSTLKQLATAKETFSNFEAFYKKFFAELNEVREEHRLELYKCQTRIDDLLKEKTAIEEQLGNSRKQAKKYKEELAATKRKQAETEWEKEKQMREISSLKVTSERLKTDKSNLELEVASLMKKLGSADQLRSLTEAKDGENSMLDVAKQEMEQLESRYRLAMEEKEALHVDIVSLQKHMGELQTQYKNNEKELQTQTQKANIKAYKAEMQLKNTTRQKETLASQLEKCQKKLKKAKDRCLALERQKLESQEMVETYKDEINVKRKQIETMNDLNQTLENKLDTMSKELCTPEVSSELLASQDESSFIQDLELSESRIHDLETSLQSTRNEKQDLERDITINRKKIIGLEESNQRSQEEIGELQQHLTVARDNATALETELFEQTNRCTQLLKELNHLREQENHLKSQLLDANHRNTAMVRKLEQALEENDEVKENASLADKKVVDLTELVKQSDERNNQLQEKISALKNEVFKFEGQNESNVKQISKLKTEIEAERGKKDKVEKELLVINSRLDEAQRSTERINRENIVKEKFSGELKKVNKTNEDKIQNLNEKLGKLEAKLEVTEEEKRELHQEVLDSQYRIKELEADNDICVQEKDRLDLDIQQLCKKINGLQSNLNVCEHEKNEFEHQAALLQQKVEKYEAELTEIMKNNADLEARIQEAISSTCQSNDEIAELRRQVDEYRSVADEIGKEVAKKDKQLEKLREKIMAVTAYSETVQDELTNTILLLQTRDREKKELKEQLGLINDEVKRLKDMENIATIQNTQLEGEVEMLKGKLQGQMEKDGGKSRDTMLLRELGEERAKANENKKKLESLKSKIDSLETVANVSKKDVHAATEDLQVAEETILNLSCNLERSLEEKKEETRRLYLLENKLKDMEEDLHLNQTMREDAEGKVCAAKKKIVQLESEVVALDKKGNLMKDQLCDANDNLMKKNGEIMSLKSKITEQDKTNEYLNHVISKKDHVIQESRDRIRTCEAELDEFRRKVRKYQVTCEGFKAENVQNEKRYLIYQDNTKKMENDIFKQREVNDALNHQVSAQTLQLNNLQNKISSLRKKKDHYKNEYENAQGSIRKAKQELLTANHRIHENGVFNETNLMKLKEKENAITALRESKIALETELIFAKTDLETLRRHFEQREEKVKKLEQSLEEAGVTTSRSFDTTINTVDIEDEDSGDISARGSPMGSGEKVMNEKMKKIRKKPGVKDDKMKSSDPRIADMESEIHDLKCAKDKLEAINDNLEKENMKLKRQLLDDNEKMSNLEVKLKYECQEKVLAESLLDNSRKITNKMQEDMFKLQQHIVEIQLLNNREKVSEKVERKDPSDQIKEGKCVLEDDNGNTEKTDNENISCQKNFADRAEESNKPNLVKEKEFLSEPQSELSKWKSLYEITSQRKTELEKEIANLHKEYEALRRSHKETFGELESAKEDVKTISKKCDNLELELKNAVKLKRGLEKQLKEREIKLGVLEDRVNKACLTLEEAQKQSATEAIESDEAETSANPLLQNAPEIMLDRKSAVTVSKENLSNVQPQEGQSKRNEQFLKEMEELRANNEELKKEIYHLQAREALGEIRKASHNNVMRKLGGNEKQEEENEEMESQESDLSTIKMAYDTLIEDILKLSGHLQNYQLNVFEWEANHDIIEVANERLLSCFSALQAVLSDLDASFKELNESICASDCNSDLVSKSMQCNNETSAEKPTSEQDTLENPKNRDLVNNSSDDSIANLRDEIYSLKKDNRMLKDCNDKLIKTVKELEKKAEIVKEELQATEMMCAAASENVILIEQGIELLAPQRNGGEEGLFHRGTISRTGCSKDGMTSKENVTNKGNVTSKQDVVSKEDEANKDVTNSEYVTSKENVTNKGDVTNSEYVTSKDNVISERVPSKDATSEKRLPSKEGSIPEVDEVKGKNVEGKGGTAEEKVVRETTKTALGSERDQLQQQEVTDVIEGKPSTRLRDPEEDSESRPTSKKSTTTPRELSEYETPKLLNVLASQNDTEGRIPKEFHLSQMYSGEVGEREKRLEMELSSAKQTITELESQLQLRSSTTTHEDGHSELISDDKNVGNGKSNKEIKVNGNINEKITDKKVEIGSAIPHEDDDSESVNDDRNVGDGKLKEEKKVNDNIGERSSGKKDMIQELQEQNQELKSQVKDYKDYREKVEALICTLRKQVATLQKELEKYRNGNLFGFNTRCNEEFNQSQIPKDFTVPTRRLFSNNKATSSPRLLHFPVRYNRATTIPSTNTRAGGLRAMSTPIPDRNMESGQGVLPEISALNLTDVTFPEKEEESLESSTADENENCPLGQNESVSEKVDGTKKEENESILAKSVLTEQQEADDEKPENKWEKVTKKNTDKKDMNDNLILEGKETKSKTNNDIESTKNDVTNIENKETQLERQVPGSCDQVVSSRLVGRNSFRSTHNLSMPNRSGLGVVPVYSGQMAGRTSYRSIKSASRTFPLTRKYY